MNRYSYRYCTGNLETNLTEIEYFEGLRTTVNYFGSILALSFVPKPAPFIPQLVRKESKSHIIKSHLLFLFCETNLPIDNIVLCNWMGKGRLHIRKLYFLCGIWLWKIFHTWLIQFQDCGYGQNSYENCNKVGYYWQTSYLHCSRKELNLSRFNFHWTGRIHDLQNIKFTRTIQVE